MKSLRRPILASAGALLLAVSLSACGSSAGGIDAVKLRVNTGVGPSHHLVTNVFEPWKEYVEQESGGKVTVEIYNGDTLGSLNSALTDLSNGVYDAGVIVPTYFQDSGAFPLTIASLAYAYPDLEVGNVVMDEFAEQFAEDISVEGVHLVDTSVSDTYSIFSKTPIRSVDDLSGQQVKVQGEADAALIEQWGANPVQIATSETYQALERGTIDAAPYTLVGNAGTNFQEVAPFVTQVNAWGTLSTPAMSQAFLDSLSPELRQQFDEDFLPELADLNDATYGKALEAAQSGLAEKLDEADGELIELSETELSRFQEGAAPQWEAWKAQAEGMGYDGQAMINAWMELLEGEGATLPQIESEQ